LSDGAQGWFRTPPGHPEGYIEAFANVYRDFAKALRSEGENACKFMKDAGYEGVQLPSDNPVVMDLKQCAESQTYADDLKGRIAECGLEITELSTHIQGQLVAVHPAYDEAFDTFAPEHLRGKPSDRQEWAVQQVKYAATASRRLGIDRSVSFPGALVWPFMYPWPQRPAGLVEEGFAELARRWRPILDHYEDEGVDICYEIHPGEDLHDGATFERFLAEVDFKAIFSKMAANDFDGWAVVEWECALKHNQDGAREGAQFVKDHIIRVTDKAFDDFAGGASDKESNRRMLGLA